MFLETIKSFRSRASSTPKAEEGKGGGGWLGSFFRSKPAIALDDDAVEGGAEQEEEDVLDPYELSKEWDVNRSLWERSWGDLSGGEGQRIALAVAFARGKGFGQGAEVVLLDGTFSFCSFFFLFPTSLSWSLALREMASPRSLCAGSGCDA